MRLRRPHPLVLVLLSTSLLCAGCVPSGRSNGSGSGGGGGDGEGNNAEQPEETLDLGRCQSGGGRLSDSQCNKFWDCNNTDFFSEEVPLFEVSCGGEPETCTCSVSGEEIAVFTAENPGDICGFFGEPAFAERVMERCLFPEGPGDIGGRGTPNNGDVEPDPPREGLEAAPSVRCVDETYSLDARYFGEVAEANVLMMWTDPPEEQSPGIEGYAWGELHPVSLEDTSTETQPSTSLSLSLQVNDVYRPGTRSLPSCMGWQSQATVVLRLDDAQQSPLTCLIWGHDPDGLINGAHSTNDLSILDDDVTTLLADCVFEEL